MSTDPSIEELRCEAIIRERRSLATFPEAGEDFMAEAMVEATGEEEPKRRDRKDIKRRCGCLNGWATLAWFVVALVN